MKKTAIDIIYVVASLVIIFLLIGEGQKSELENDSLKAQIVQLKTDQRNNAAILKRVDRLQQRYGHIISWADEYRHEEYVNYTGSKGEN